MSIIAFLLAFYLLAFVIGCTMITIGSIIQGIFKLIMMILTVLFSLFG